MGAQFDEARIKRIAALAEAAQSNAEKNWTPDSIFARLDEAIIGNERYKRSLAVSISDFLSESRLRNHLLVTGPSGTGKTYLLEQTLPTFGIPYVVIDASSLVPAGYKGNTLQESLAGFFSINATAARQCVVVLDEFDKVSERANGGDTHKSHSIQSELLTLIQGKQEGAIDTRNALWILLGAFAYADEMRHAKPSLTKTDLLKYGFKNELLGRITKVAMTDVPTVEQVVRRVAADKAVRALSEDLAKSGYTIEFDDAAFLALAMSAQNPQFGMRIIPSAVANLKEFVIFECQKGAVTITEAMIARAVGG